MKLFETKKIGVNINDDSIELIEMSLVHGHGVLTNFQKINLENGLVEFAYIKNKKKLKEILVSLFENGINGKFNKGELVFAIQEGNLYSHLLSLNPENNAEKELKENIDKKLPEKIENYVFTYKNINQIENINSADKSNLIYVSSVKKKLLKEWSTLFKEIGYKISYFEPKTIALNRFLGIKDRNILILDLNFSSANISVFLDNQIFYSYEINFEEEILSKLTKNDFKKNNLNKENEKSSLLKQLLEPIIGELEKSIFYIKENTDRNVQEIYLSGLGSRIGGLDSFLKKKLDEANIKINYFSSLNKTKNVKSDFYAGIGLVSGEYNKKEICFKKAEKVLSDIGFFAFLVLLKNNLKLFSILIFFLFLALFSYLYVDYSGENTKIQSIENKYLYNDEFSYEVFLASDNILRENEIKGRLFEITFENPLSLEEISKEAKEKLLTEIKGGEFYWETPVGNTLNNNSLIFPLKTIWFIGNNEQLKDVISSKISDKLSGEQYEIDIFKNASIDLNVYESLYRTNLKIILNHSLDIDKFDLKEVNIKRVVIINANGNKINIRKGPGVNFSIIGKATEGEAYLYLRELDSWVNLELSNGELAWISGHFVKLLD